MNSKLHKALQRFIRSERLRAQHQRRVCRKDVFYSSFTECRYQGQIEILRRLADLLRKGQK